MDKAEQPTIAQADEILREIFLYGHSEGWTGNQTRRDVQQVDAENGWSLYVSNGALEKTKARHRTTSLAAQDDWTTKRVAELVAEGYGHWRSCTGCHETNEGAETGDYPFNPVFKTYQGGGCGECGRIGVVWDDIDYADYAEFCLNADDDAPSLAAQDGLVAEIERQEGLVKTYRGAQLRAEEKLCREQANAQGWKRRAEILESKLAALSAIKEQHHD